MPPELWPDVRRLCMTCISARCRREGAYCCRKLDVYVSEKERERIEQRLDEIAVFAPWLRLAGDTYDDVFAAEEEAGLRIEHRADGGCSFLFRDAEGAERCAIHAAALAAGDDPLRLKPRTCATWPLALSDASVDLVREAHAYGCVGEPRDGAPRLIDQAHALLEEGSRRAPPT